MICVLLAVALAATLGRAPTAARWGQAGVDCMYAAGIICGLASVLAMGPMMFAALWFRSYVGEAALAATVLRLLLTTAMCLGYQIWSKPDLKPFLLWALIFYGLMLVIDTVFSVLIVRHLFGQKRVEVVSA